MLVRFPDFLRQRQCIGYPTHTHPSDETQNEHTYAYPTSRSVCTTSLTNSSLSTHESSNNVVPGKTMARPPEVEASYPEPEPLVVVVVVANCALELESLMCPLRVPEPEWPLVGPALEGPACGVESCESVESDSPSVSLMVGMSR